MEMQISLKVIRILVIVVGVLTVKGIVAGQNTAHHFFSHLTTEDGLPISRIRCFLQDQQGFMWVGTEAGLNRYEGREFTIFKHHSAIPGTLTNSSVLALLEDSSGSFWVGTRGGLQLMDRDRNLFFPSHMPADHPLSAVRHVLVLRESRSGYIWIGTTGGLFRLSVRPGVRPSPDSLDIQFKQKELELTAITFGLGSSDDTAGRRVWCLEEDREGYFWIGTTTGLYRLGPDQVTAMPADQVFPDGVTMPAGLSVQALETDHAGNLWIGTNAGLLRLSADRLSMRVFRANGSGPGSISDDFITELEEDDQHNLWIGSDGGGLDLWDAETTTFVHLQHDRNNPGSLGDNNVEALYEDRQGGLWVGTHRGISFHNRYRKPFSLYRENGMAGSVPPGMINSFFERPDGRIWIGVDDNGLGLLDLKTGVITSYRHVPGNPESIADDDVTTVLEDRAGMVWVGSWGGGLSRFKAAPTPVRPGTGFVHFMPDNNPGSLNDEDIWTLFEDREGVIWVGTVDGGLNRFDRESGTFRIYRHDPGDPGSIMSNWVLDIWQEPSGKFWVATTGGMSRFDPASGRFDNYPVQAPVGMTAVYAIQPDGAGGYWLATRSGLALFEPLTRTYTFWQERDGLADDYVLSLLKDRSGDLWMGTGTGLSRFDPETRVFRNYDVHDGLQAGEFSVAHLETRSGEFLFGGVSGFNVFHPESIRHNTIMPPVVLTDFRIFNQPVPVQGSVADSVKGVFTLDRSILHTEVLELAYWQNDIAFGFAALNFLDPGKNRYKYQLKGYKDAWIETEPGQNLVSYTNLAPGQYTFRVIAANNDGVWNVTGTSIRLVIHAPWWKTWWAYLSYLLIGAGLFYLFRRYELNRQRLKHDLELEQVEAEKLKELNAAKSRLYANITHEFRTPLTVILGMTEQAERDPGTKLQEAIKLIRRNGSHLLALVNQMLDLTKLESNRMSVQLIQGDIVAYVKYVTESFLSMAEGKDLRLELAADQDSIFMDYDPGKILQLLSNLISNAIKFTPPGGSIRLHVSTEDPGSPAPTNLIVRIRDTGIGIAPEHLPHIFDRFYQADNSNTRKGEGTGIGLALAKELMRLFHGDISVESTLGTGTEFTLRLPIQRTAPLEQTIPVVPRQPVVPVATETPASPVTASTPAGEPDWPLLLLVEDNADVRTYLISCLDNQYRLITAVNGQEGIEKALEHIPDIIISDVMMPEKDGFEVCDALKRDPRTSHVPVVLLTARAAVEDRIAGLERGADAYMAKPFNQEELLVQLQNLLQSRRRLQDRYRRLDAPVAHASPDEKIEDAFLLDLRGVIETEINNADLSIEALCRRIGMSRMQLHRKIKALTGRSTALYVRSVRLQRAMELLAGSDMNVSEIAYAVGFDDPKYFSRVFSEEFGLAPSEVRGN